MGSRLVAFPDRPSDTQQVTLDGVQYLVRFTWRDRTASWYLDLFAADGTAIIEGRRLSPGWSPSLEQDGDAGLLAGLLFVRGVDTFVRASLGGDDLAVAYYTADEIDAAAPETTEPRIVVA